MKCPVCNMSMIEEDFGGAKVDVCAEGCKGIWFDWQELARLDEKNEGFGQALEEAIDSPRVNDASRGAIHCPKCSLPMHRHLYKSDKEVNVDECYNCGGIFLDSGELTHIREHYLTEPERAAYLEKLVADVPSYQHAQDDLKKAKLRAEAVGKFTRLLRPF